MRDEVVSKDASFSDRSGGADLPRVRLSTFFKEGILSHHARQPNHDSPRSQLAVDYFQSSSIRGLRTRRFDSER